MDSPALRTGWGTAVVEVEEMAWATALGKAAVKGPQRLARETERVNLTGLATAMERAMGT